MILCYFHIQLIITVNLNRNIIILTVFLTKNHSLQNIIVALKNEYYLTTVPKELSIMSALIRDCSQYVMHGAWITKA
jgi:hypothetical protein